jgi:hypothetical protein
MAAKKQIITKASVQQRKTSARTTAAKSTIKKPVQPKKPVAEAKTPSLINAVPMSAVSPKTPEQLLYVPEMLKDENKAEPSAQAVQPKRGRGRPRKIEQVSEERSTPAVAAASPGVTKQPEQATHGAPIAPASPVAVPVAARKKSRPMRINRRLLTVLMIFVVLVAGGWYWHSAHAEDSASANAKLVAEIGKHVVLPKGETPTISTVVDETKVNQDFLKNAKKGDKVLLYFQSSQAIVYRPSTGQVVNMGPLQTPRPRVFIRQGSTANNASIVKNLVSSSNEFLVASQDQSPNKSYDKTIVVDLTGNRPDLAGHLAQLLHVNVGNLPAGELPPDADLMVIVGSDFK